MNISSTRILKFTFVLFFSLSFSQNKNSDSLIGKFTYLLEYMPNLLAKDHIAKELYSLQISNKRSFLVKIT